jgi:CRISPR/Cas system CSM-associated protein Csm3 (group 7 of RAMP superfamily)
MFVKKIKKEHKSESDMKERIDSCSNERMFNNLLKLIEDKEDHEKMPVRKFFNNTFGTLLNDAIFALMKK